MTAAVFKLPDQLFRGCVSFVVLQVVQSEYAKYQYKISIFQCCQKMCIYIYVLIYVVHIAPAAVAAGGAEGNAIAFGAKPQFPPPVFRYLYPDPPSFKFYTYTQVWRPLPPSTFRSAQQLEVFSFDDGRTCVDIMTLAPWKHLQHELVLWEKSEPSDLQGCLTLSSPKPASCPLALEDKKYPILLMLRDLARQGLAPYMGGLMA